MYEVEHKVIILEEAKQALLDKNGYLLKEISNRTVHSSSSHQDTGSILIAVLIYALSKLIERRDYTRIKDWDEMVDKINSLITAAIKAAMEDDEEKFGIFLGKVRKTIEDISADLKPYVQEVMRKACVNKACRIYEHGISMGQTAKLLGITKWELSEYAGQSRASEIKFNQTLNEKTRAKMALEFFS